MRSLLLLAFALAVSPLSANSDGVVIVANATEPSSVELARWYAEQRGIPAANVVALRMPPQESISREEFERVLLKPLSQWLLENRWIDGLRRGDFIEAYSHRISHLVLMRGVPLRVEHEGKPLSWDEQIRMAPQQFKTASVDSELALLPQGVWRLEGPLPNPLFEKETPLSFDLKRVLKVTRLDGPSAEDVRMIVREGLEAERLGLAGRAYVDIGGPIPEGDRWFEDVERRIRDLGFDLDVEGRERRFGALSRFDSPALYFGWYAPRADGPFTSPTLRFSPGAIAFHLHSFSGETVRSPTGGWLGPLVSRGAAVTFGNVAEPRLQLTQRPQHILRKLIEGANLGDAAAYGTPALSWQTVTLGDPLYRPFKVNLRQQLNQLDAQPPERAPWIVVRQARLDSLAGQPERALERVRAFEAEHPGVAITLELARMLEASGDREAAIQALEKLQYVPVFGPQSWRVGADAAQLAADLGAPGIAHRMYDTLIAQVQLSKEARIWLLEKALPISPGTRERAVSERWNRLLQELKPPPPPKETNSAPATKP